MRRQLLDPNQLRLFSLTLDRPKLWPGEDSSSLEDEEPKAGTPLPPAYHLAYFTPAQLPGILGVDGTDASFNPEHPFTRRMWAGGLIHWPNSSRNESSQHYLRVGDVATEVTKVLSCEPKVIKKTGETMLVVGVEKEFRDSRDNLCVLDRRNWVFREALDPSKPATPPKKPSLKSDAELQELSKGMITQRYNRDVVQLFRMSAVTFNGHRIHYDLPWAQNVEGHRNVVVHGPLNLLTMLDIWRDHTSSKTETTVVYPKEIEYRATSPVYAGEAYQILMNKDFFEKNEGNMQGLCDDGTTLFKGTIRDWT